MMRVEVTFVIITQRGKVLQQLQFSLHKIQLKDRSFIGYDIVLVLVWLTFVSLYPIVNANGKMI